MQEPNVYRTYEAVTHYGEAIKLLINEQCGDGIMSAIDFIWTWAQPLATWARSARSSRSMASSFRTLSKQRSTMVRRVHGIERIRRGGACCGAVV